MTRAALALTLLAACSVRPEVRVDDRGAVTAPLTLRVDSAFSEQERAEITLAADAWDRAAGRRLLTLLHGQPRPGLLHEHLDAPPMLWRVSKVGHDLTARQFVELFSAQGFTYRGSSVQAIVFDDTPRGDFYRVTLHELGHVLGLGHITDRGALMAPNASVPCLTVWDAAALCRLYGCDPRPQCTIYERTFHDLHQVPSE